MDPIWAQGLNPHFVGQIHPWQLNTLEWIRAHAVFHNSFTSWDLYQDYQDYQDDGTFMNIDGIQPTEGSSLRSQNIDSGKNDMILEMESPWFEDILRWKTPTHQALGQPSVTR